MAALLLGADVSGKWKGSFGGGGGDRDLTFDLKASGATLTGTVSGMLDKPIEIKDGKVEGDTVSFWLMSEYQGQPVKLVYKGAASASEIRFTMGTEDGGWSTELVAKKVP